MSAIEVSAQAPGGASGFSGGPSARRVIPALDGLRGLAILLVYFYHYAGGSRSNTPLVKAVAAVKEGGWTGVDLFLVLSGFLITGILLDTATDRDRAQNFYVRRALRIMPAYLLMSVLLIALTPVIKAVWTFGHLAFLLYAQNIATVIRPQLAGPSRYISLDHLWSLAVEEQFYLIWPWIVWHTPRQKLLKVCFSLVVVSLVCRSIAVHWSYSASYQLLPCRIDGFMIGAIIAVAGRAGIDLRSSALPVALSGGAAFIVIAWFGGSALMASSLPMATLGIISVEFCFGGMVIAAINGGVIATIFSAKLLRFFGRYSYGLYLYHEIPKPTWFLIAPSSLVGQILFLLLTLGVNTGAAVISYHLFEKRFLAMKNILAPKHA